jgi:hypothetical protein
MARIDWHLQGLNVTNCSCAWGCPCQFLSLPTHGYCHAAVFMQVSKGHFGSTRLDGLAFGGVFAWPEAIHLGNGEVQPVVDVRATPVQREAILKIMTGQETEPGATIFNVFAATYSKVHAPAFARITIEADLAARKARVAVDGIVDASVEPILNPITGQPARARIQMPEGFEYDVAECASGTVRTSGSPIKLDWAGRHAHIAPLDMTGAGVVHTGG